MLNYLCVDLYAESLAETWPKVNVSVDLYVENLAENWPAGFGLGSVWVRRLGKRRTQDVNLRRRSPGRPKRRRFSAWGGRTAGDALRCGTCGQGFGEDLQLYV